MSTTESISPDKDKAGITVAAVILVTAVIVLVIDWKIKDTILREATRIRGEMERYEKKYFAGSFGYKPDLPTSSDYGVGGVTGVEEAITTSGDEGEISEAAASNLRDINRSYARARISGVEVPKGNS